MFRKTSLVLSVFTGLLVLAVSCLKDKPESLPQHLVWDPDVTFPLGSDHFGLDAESGFDTTLFELDTLTNLPGWVNQPEVVLEGRIEFDLSSLNEAVDDLNSILFRVNIFNGFPNRVLNQIYFQDAASNYIDSMFTEGAIEVPPGTVQGNGETIKPAVVRQDAVIKRERIGPLEEATVLLLRATFPTPEVDSSLVPYYRTYEINVEIGTMLDLTIEF